MELDNFIWPVHPQRQPDELLSSWLVRISHALNLKVHTFASLGLPGYAIWNRDIDKNAQLELLEMVAKRTGRVISEVEQATLSSLDNILVSGKIFSGRSQWVMPLGIYHRTHRNKGLVFCPMCLTEDESPYFRRTWRLAFSVVCSKHKIAMHDSCPQCGAAVIFFRHDFNKYLSTTQIDIAECYNCKFDLRNVRQSTIEDEDFLAFIKSLEDMCETQIAIVNNSILYSFLYYDVIHQLLKLLTHDRFGVKLRWAIENLSGIETKQVVIPQLSNSFETLSIGLRKYALQLVSWVVKNWPDRFIMAVKQSDLTRSRLTRDMGNIPFWFDSVLREYFDRSTYSPSHEEINSIYIWLKANKNNITKRSLSTYLGCSESKVVSEYLASRNFLYNLNE